MLRKTPRMKHGATLCSLWPMDGTEADGAGFGHLKHAIGPFLPVIPIQHDLSQLHPGGESLGTMLCPSPVHQIVQFGLVNHNPHGFDKGALSFAGLLFQVFVKHVRRFKVCK
ncbi:hypothetical protein TNIN_124261 [Trichonephila inaurata madagascariensis]|uniref:Uncharacterized protein n=1 Tax=Trichonephila inaurata madagascariensis TaxID=2747483 RepID=A0A8X6X1N6_9ARAC|nr:hypothetical protein TNIN_124261 [Trichonephila inaurata madagascariensis]